ncbi:MAG: hypothetical protein LBH11_06960, partial [Propionibacteriaceae bacterium]|nr:hypothetical protein [Propionibacteriaceae bacterium]
MARTVAEANSILARIEHMPFGPARTQAAATEAARVEADGPEQCLAYSLNVLIASYTFTGEQEKAYVPFSRLVKLYDTRPDLFDEKDHYDLQWAFKWMVNGLSSFPGVSAERIDAAIADMESRFGVDGIGAKTVIRSRYFWALHRYGKDAAEPYFQKWLVTPNDNVFGTECDMCTCNTDVFHSIEADDWEDALAKFDTALADPENPSRCFQEPAAMGSALLPWLARRGQPGDDDRARTLYRRVREQADADPTDFVAVLGRMVQFLASSGHPKRALRYLEKNSKWLVKAESPLERLQFVSRVAGGLRLLVEHYGMGDTAVSISEVPAATVSELHQWTARETRAIAAEFDARNGTATVSQRAEQVMAANPTGRVLDLTLRLEPDGADTDGAQQPITASVTTFPGAAGTFDPTVANSGETAGAALAANQSTSEQDAQAALDTAEDKARHGDVEGAVSHYVAAASAYRAAGRLRDAGFAYAEAAAHTYNLD